MLEKIRSALFFICSIHIIRTTKDTTTSTCRSELPTPYYGSVPTPPLVENADCDLSRFDLPCLFCMSGRSVSPLPPSPLVWRLFRQQASITHSFVRFSWWNFKNTEYNRYTCVHYHIHAYTHAHIHVHTHTYIHRMHSYLTKLEFLFLFFFLFCFCFVLYNAVHFETFFFPGRRYRRQCTCYLRCSSAIDVNRAHLISCIDLTQTSLVSLILSKITIAVQFPAHILARHLR